MKAAQTPAEMSGTVRAVGRAVGRTAHFSPEGAEVMTRREQMTAGFHGAETEV